MDSASDSPVQVRVLGFSASAPFLALLAHVFALRFVVVAAVPVDMAVVAVPVRDAFFSLLLVYRARRSINIRYPLLSS
jgi:hypothetical protein